MNSPELSTESIRERAAPSPVAAGDHVGRLAAVARYYDESWFDYRVIWQNSENRALHFGVWYPGTKSHGESLLNMNREVAGSIDIKPGMRVLDAGCGVGGSSMWLAENYDVSVVGITVAERQVEMARKFAQERGLEKRVSFELADFTNTKFPDGSFDIVWAQESACHAEDKAAFLREAFRVLRPGGQLVVEDWFRVTRDLPARQEKLLIDWVNCWAIPDLSTGDEFAVAARACGFDGTTIRDLSMFVRPSLARLYRLGVASYPFWAVVHRLGLRSAHAQANLRGAILQWRALNQRLWFDAIFTATRPNSDG